MNAISLFDVCAELLVAEGLLSALLSVEVVQAAIVSVRVMALSDAMDKRFKFFNYLSLKNGSKRIFPRKSVIITLAHMNPGAALVRLPPDSYNRSRVSLRRYIQRRLRAGCNLTWFACIWRLPTHYLFCVYFAFASTLLILRVFCFDFLSGFGVNVFPVVDRLAGNVVIDPVE